MTLLTKADITKFLLESTTSKARSSTYTRLLGFLKPSQNTSRPGPPKLDDLVQEFYDALTSSVDKLLRVYSTRSQLRQTIKTQEAFRREDIEDCLDKYGPKVWNDGVAAPFVTYLNGDVYPRHLVYSNELDRLSIRTYVYCLVLQRTWTKQGKKPLYADGDEPDTSAPLQSPRNEQITSESLNDNAASGTSKDPRGGGQTDLRNVRQYLAPVAQMIPGHVSQQNQTQQLAEVQSSNSTENPMVWVSLGCSNVRRGLQVEIMSDSTTCHTNESLDAGTESSEVESEDTEQIKSPRKRQRCTNDTYSGINFNALRSNGRTKYAARLRRKGSLGGISYPSLPAILPTIKGSRSEKETEGSLATPIQDNFECSRSNADVNELPLSLQGLANNNLPDASQTESVIILRASEDISNDHDEVDSVQGTSDQADVERHGSIATTPRDDTPPQLVVKIKVSSVEAKLRADRKRLAFKLPIALDLHSQQSDLFEETIELISRMKTTDGERLKSNFGDPEWPYQRILSQWLDLMHIFIAFRRTTQFSGDLGTWGTHLTSLNSDNRFSMAQQRIKTSILIDEWLLEHKKLYFSVQHFSRDVTHVVLSMADWMRVLSNDEFEGLKSCMTRFNQDLLDWFY